MQSAASATAGVGVRDRSPKARETHLAAVVRKRVTSTGLTGNEALTAVGAEVVELLGLAFERIPGRRELSKNALSVPEFRKRYLHSATAGLHVIANAIASAASPVSIRARWWTPSPSSHGSAMLCEPFPPTRRPAPRSTRCTSSAPATPGAPDRPTRYDRLVARNAKLKRRNREVTNSKPRRASHA